jgi:hypothetical protein
MERLPYIDAHGVDVATDAGPAWAALVRVVGGSFGATGSSWVGRLLGVHPRTPHGPWSPTPGATGDGPAVGAAVPGFTVDRVRPGELLSLRGRHRFSRYRLDFELVAAEPGRSWVWARTWAEFPGAAGAAYRALVIGTGGHAVAVRRLLRRVAADA